MQIRKWVAMFKKFLYFYITIWEVICSFNVWIRLIKQYGKNTTLTFQNLGKCSLFQDTQINVAYGFSYGISNDHTCKSLPFLGGINEQLR